MPPSRLRHVPRARTAGAFAVIALAGALPMAPALAPAAVAAETAPGASTPATAVWLSRATGLNPSGDEITVTVRGLAPGARVSVALWATGGPAAPAADRAGARELVADATGFAATQLTVGTSFAPGATAYEVRATPDRGTAAALPVTFAAPAASPATTPGTTPETAAAPAAGARSLQAVPRSVSPAAANAAPAAAPMAAASGVSVQVSPTTGLNPDGATLTVTGKGFDPARNNKVGVYVAFGPKNADWATNANAFGVAVWVRPGQASGSGQATMNADGSFTVQLKNVKARYTDGDGKSVDCTATQCYVLTMAAHGANDRSQDTATPVSFTGSGSGSTGGSTGSSGGTGSTGGTTGGGDTTGGADGGATGGSGGSGGSGGGSGGGGSLALTGPAGITAGAVLGAGLLATGAVVVTGARRRRSSSAA